MNCRFNKTHRGQLQVGLLRHSPSVHTVFTYRADHRQALGPSTPVLMAHRQRPECWLTRCSLLRLAMRSGAIALLLAVAARAWPQLPPSLSVTGVLLAHTQLTEHLAVGIYGPATVNTQDAVLLTVLIQGDQTTAIGAGLVLWSFPEDTVRYGSSPPSAGWYVPFGQWSPDRESEWRQFLVVNPHSAWASQVISMAPAGYQVGTAGLLDALMADPLCPAPQPGSVVRNPDDYDHLGMCFIADEASGSTDKALAAIRAGTTSSGAHGIRLSSLVSTSDPTATLGLWLVLHVNGAYITSMMTANLTPRERAREEKQAVEGAPIVHEPEDGAIATDPVLVSGETSPGSLVAAWLEAYSPQEPQTRASSRVHRRIAGLDGAFEVLIAVPFADLPAETDLTCEVHVQSEAPGYKSPETVRKVQLTRSR